MVKSWASLTDDVKRKKLYQAYVDPLYFMTDKYFIGDALDEPFPFQVYVLRKLWMPINEVNGKPNQYIREFDGLAGMRTGKTATTGLSSAFCAYKLHRIAQKQEGWTPAREFGLLKKQKLVISNVAVNEDQSVATIFDATRGFIEESPYFQELAADVTMYTKKIIFKNENFVLWALGSNSSSAAGKTSPLVSIDEVDQFDDTEGPQGIDAVYKLLRNATKTLWVASEGEFGKVQAISSSGPPGSKMWRLKAEADEVQGVRMWIKVPTWYDAIENPLGNPNISFEDLNEDRLADAESFWQLYGCNPRFTSKIYFKDYDEVVKPCFDHDRVNILDIIWKGIRDIQRTTEYKTISGSNRTNRRIQHLIENIRDYVDLRDFDILDGSLYTMTGDPSSKGDSFGVCLAHIDPTKPVIHHKVYEYNTKGVLKAQKPVTHKFKHIVIDGIFSFKPNNREIPVEDIEALFLCTHEFFKYKRAGFDIWAYAHLMSNLRDRRVKVFKRMTLFSEYETFTNSLKIRTLSMLYHKTLDTELKELQRLPTTNNVRIDHPAKGSKDLADAMVLAIVGLMQKSSGTTGPGVTTPHQVSSVSKRTAFLQSQRETPMRQMGYMRRAMRQQFFRR